MQLDEPLFFSNSPLSLNIIGAGHLGKTLGFLLAQHPLSVHIGAICNTSYESANAACQFIGSGRGYANIAELPPADITLIATPDDQIESTALELSKNPFLKKNSVVFHCSGALSSEILNPLSEKGCIVASVHPMKSFAAPELSIKTYPGTYCAMEGDKLALVVLKRLFETIGSIPYEINKLKKSYYHAAGVFASNYLITLASQALDCLQNAGVEKDMAMQIINSLMKSSLSNLENTQSPKKSLTGPIQRGDVATIKKHLAVLNDEQKALYSALGKATLALTEHQKAQQEKIEQALE